MLINDEIRRPPAGRETALPECMKPHLTELTAKRLTSTQQLATRAQVKLDFTIEKQVQSNWCWSAVAVSVGNYYKTGSWTQCGVASAHLDRECCQQPRPCNIASNLDGALKITRSFSSMLLARLQPDVMEQQIRQGRPIGLRCAWQGGGAHFMVIYGFNDAYIMVADSIYGYSLNFIYSFPLLYNGGGSWTHTYFTRNTLENPS